MNTLMRTSRRWNQAGLAEFKRSLSDSLGVDDVGGKTWQVFGQGLKGVDLARLPDGQVKRSEVFALAADSGTNTATVCAAAMAWGGMNMRFHHKFFALAGEGWLKVAEGIRAGNLHRKVAYDAFSDLRHEDKLYGVGPAYFTKLIYFLTPRDREDVAHGYIMDQWAGCSINLLLDDEVVLMNVTRSWQRDAVKPQHTFTVSDANTGENYEVFCAAVDELRGMVGLCADAADRAMLANGGKKKSDWRQYVIDHRAL